MKTPCLWFAAAALLLATPPPILALDEISVDFFYDHLEPYGYWREVGDYGYCWQPADVDEDWRPYSDGAWVYTDAGWTWESGEPYGWAVYHYGRWANVAEIGWVWIPGTEWGPGWVSWRHSPQYVGWAPRPPEATFSISIGFRSWVDDYYDIGPSSYCFVENRHFGSRRLRDVFVDRRQNLTIINQTTNITNISYVNNVVYNGGPRYDQQSRQSAEPIHRYRLDRRQRFDGDPRRQSADHFQARVEGDSLRVMAPSFGRHTSDHRPGKVTERVKSPEVDRGWRDAGSPTKIAELRSHLRSKTQISKELPPQPKFEREAERRGPEVSERPVGREPARADATPMREKVRGDGSADSDQPPSNPAARSGVADQPPTPGDRPDRENGKGMVRPGNKPPGGPGAGHAPSDRPRDEAPGAAPKPDRPGPDSPPPGPGAGSTLPVMPPHATERPKSEEAKHPEPRPEATKRPESSPESSRPPAPSPEAMKRPEPKRHEMKRSESPESARHSTPRPEATKRPEPKREEARRPSPNNPSTQRRPEARSSKPGPNPPPSGGSSDAKQNETKRTTSPNPRVRSPDDTPLWGSLGKKERFL